MNLKWKTDPRLPCTTYSIVRPGTPSERAGAMALYLDADLPFDQDISYVWMSDRYLGYTPTKKRAVVCDLHTGQVTTVYQVPHGSQRVVDYSVGSQGTVVYSTLSKRPNVTNGEPATWTIEAVDLRTGKHRHVAKSAGVDHADALYDFLPQPVVDWPWVAWLQPDRKRRVEDVPDTRDAGVGAVHTYDLRSGRHRVIAPDAVRPEQVELAEGFVVFDGTSAGADPSRVRSLFVAPADGSKPPTHLTDQDAVLPPSGANGRVSWQSRPSVGAEPDALWTMAVGYPDTPVRLLPGADHSVPSEEFVVAQVDDVASKLHKALVAYDVANPGAPPLVLAEESRLQMLDLGTRWDVHGNRVVWATIADPLGRQRDRHLRIARVVRE